MANKALSKINGRLKFLYRNQSYLDNFLRRLLANALIQPHFDYACSAWFPNLNKGFTKKIQIAQNKCIRFCLSLGNRSHIGVNEFKEINWLPVKERAHQCINVSIFKYFKNMCPAYSSEMFIVADQSRFTRNSVMKLNLPFRNRNTGQNCISYLGPKIWNKLPSHIKLCDSINSFKHKIKDKYFADMKKKRKKIYISTTRYLRVSKYYPFFGQGTIMEIRLIYSFSDFIPITTSNYTKLKGVYMYIIISL